jgi:hypothetical protein
MQRIGVIIALALALSTAGCGGTKGAAPRQGATTGTGAKVPVPTRCRSGDDVGLRSDRSAYLAVVKGPTRAFARPRGAVRHSFARLNANGVQNLFGILSMVVDSRCRPEWYHVQLPLKPNGATGYVRAHDVLIGRVTTRVVIDVSRRRVELFRYGRKILTTTAAVGSSATPTPTGSYYVNQKIRVVDPSGPYGPGAIGISAFSPVLTGWTQGGPIAIHGTNDPSSIGQAVSNGCIRVRNDVLRRLFSLTPAGTPVVIRA